MTALIHRTLLVVALVLCGVPATASAADDTLTRAAFGNGTVLASSTAPRPAAPVCTTPAANPAGTQADCAPIGAGAFGTCTDHPNNTGSHCDITVSAEAPLGWRFDHWSGGRCVGTNPICSFRTTETTCTGGPQSQCEDTRGLGPWTVIAHFEDTRRPAIKPATGPPSDGVIISDTRQQIFAYSTDEDDEAPTFQCRHDGGDPFPCGSPHTWDALTDGKHEFCVTAIDASGLASVTPRCLRWEQETTPSAAIATGPPAATSATGAVFTYTSNKTAHPADGSTLSFECALDAGAFAPCAASGKTIAGLSDGTHQFAVRAIFHGALDAPGSTHTSAAASRTWVVDTAPPDPTITSAPLENATIVDVPPTVALSASDGVRAPRIAAAVTARGSASATSTTFKRLLVTGVPAGARVELRCTARQGAKRACPFMRRSLKIANTKAQGLRAGRAFVLGVGATLEVRVTAPGLIGKVMRLPILKRKFPRLQTLCLPPGARTPASC